MTPGPILALVARAALASAGAIAVCDHIQDPATLDPARQFAEKNLIVVQQMYEGLLRFDSEGRIEPALAESWRRLDPLTVEFRLREGVRFHNGEAFDARSARFSIERYLDPAVGSPAFGFLDTIERVEAVDPFTLRVRTRVPDGLLLNRLAAFVLIMPPGYLREEGPDALSTRPVGTGPFRFGRWNKGHSIELEANPGYWMTGYPRSSRLIFRFLPKEEQLPALLRGELDIVTDVPGTKTAEIARSGIARVIKKPTFYTVGATLRVDEGPLKDARVRRALNYALDKADLIRYDQMGNAAQIASLTMPGQEGHALDIAPYPHDPARARELLAEAGYRGGLRLKALAQIESRRTVQIIASQWERVGVRLDIEWTDDESLLEDLRVKKPDLAIGGCPDPMAHAYFITGIYLHSKSPYSLTRSPELDALMEKGIAATDEKEASRLFQEADRLIHRDALSIFTYRKIAAAAVREGVSFRPFVTGMPHFYAVAREAPR